MSQINDEPQFAPYQQYLAGIRQIEDFAEQTRFCYNITQRFVGDSGDGGANDAESQDGVFGRTTDVLNTSCFLMEWLFFETFLKNTVTALLQRHPGKISAGNPIQTFTYQELAQASGNFSSIDQLRSRLIADTIEAQHLSSRSVQGLIDYLRQVFHFQVNPYEIEFLYKGQRTTTSARDLADIRAMYKYIAGDAMIEDTATGIEYDVDPTDNRSTIGEEDFLRAKAILNATAGVITDTIMNGWYDLK